MIWLVPALFSVACAVTSWLALRSDARGAGSIAVSLFALWALANAAWVKDALWLLPVFDLGLAVLVLRIRLMTQARWVALVADAIAVRMALHVIEGVTGHLYHIAYLHALNATFAWMLVVVADAGGGHARSTTDRLGDLRRRLLWLGGFRAPASAGEVGNGGR